MSHRVLEVQAPTTGDEPGAGGVAPAVLRSLLTPSAHHSGLPTLELHALLELRTARATGMDTWQLAERLALGAAATNALLDRLEHDGLVELPSTPVVRRGDAVRLTSEGKRMAAVTLSRLNGALTRALRGEAP